MVVVVRI